MPGCSTCRRARRRRLSASNGGAASPSGQEKNGAPHRLAFDYSFPFIGTDVDFRLLPRLLIYVAGPRLDAPPVRAVPLLDSGADYSAFDGTTAQQLGWREGDIRQRAEATHPIYGLTTGGRQTVGYLHRLTCLIPLGRRYASLPLRVLITLPNTLSAPVLGRRDFFRQVDFALIEAEQRFLLRFRSPSSLRDSW